MRRIIYYRRLKQLIKIINTKISNLPKNPLDSDCILFYPYSEEIYPPDSASRVLIKKIESNFEKCDGESFGVLLSGYMAKKSLSAREIYIPAVIEKSYFYQIKKGQYIPSRNKVIRVALAMKLNLEESKRLLQTLGYCLYEKNRRDMIIAECVNHRTGLYTAELLLNHYGEVSLYD